jgi:hypothetical protein
VPRDAKRRPPHTDAAPNNFTSTTASLIDTTVNPAEVAALIVLSDERDTWLARIDDVARSEYARGRRGGYERGRRDEAAEMATSWNKIARPIARGGPSFDELERRRWTLRGESRTRRSFSQPHPADFAGQGGDAS